MSDACNYKKYRTFTQIDTVSVLIIVQIFCHISESGSLYTDLRLVPSVGQRRSLLLHHHHLLHVLKGWVCGHHVLVGHEVLFGRVYTDNNKTKQELTSTHTRRWRTYNAREPCGHVFTHASRPGISYVPDLTMPAMHLIMSSHDAF